LLEWVRVQFYQRLLNILLSLVAVVVQVVPQQQATAVVLAVQVDRLVLQQLLVELHIR
jgi:hypothetical protein